MVQFFASAPSHRERLLEISCIDAVASHRKPPARHILDGRRGNDVTGRRHGKRTRLSGVAYRMLGSRSDAEDALQEFDVPFEEIAPIVGRSSAAARQLASRARRRVQGATLEGGDDGRTRSEIVRAFLAASRSGDLEGLISLLDPSVVLRADAAAVAIGATAEVHGAAAVAETFSGRARAARPALVDDAFALVWAQGGAPRVVFAFTFGDGVIVGIDLIADPDRLARFSIEFITTEADEQ